MLHHLLGLCLLPALMTTITHCLCTFSLIFIFLIPPHIKPFILSQATELFYSIHTVIFLPFPEEIMLSQSYPNTRTPFFSFFLLFCEETSKNSQYISKRNQPKDTFQSFPLLYQSLVYSLLVDLSNRSSPTILINNFLYHLYISLFKTSSKYYSQQCQFLHKNLISYGKLATALQDPEYGQPLHQRG